MSNTINPNQIVTSTLLGTDPSSSDPFSEILNPAPSTTQGIGGTNFNSSLQQANNLMQDGNPDDALAGQQLQDQTEEKIAAAAAAEKARHDMIMSIISDIQQSKDTA